MERYYQIGKANLKFNLYPHLLLSIFLLAISPLVMGVANLDAPNTARVLEMYVALLGVILLTPLFLPEQNSEVRDLVGSKYTSQTVVILIRLLEAVILLGVLVGGYIILLSYNGCTFPELYFYLGTLSEAIFLGGMGFCAYSIFDQIAIAYMLPTMFYILSMGSGKKILKDFYLFSMRYGSYKEKVFLVITGVVLIVIGVSYPYLSKRVFAMLIRIKVRNKSKK